MNNKIPIKRDYSKNLTIKILLDGSIRKQNTSSSIISKNVLKFDYETLKKYKKKRNFKKNY